MALDETIEQIGTAIMKSLQDPAGKLTPSEAMKICVEARYLALGMAMVGDGGSARLNERTQRLRAELVEWADEFTEMLDVALEWRDLAEVKAEVKAAEGKMKARRASLDRGLHLSVVAALRILRALPPPVCFRLSA
jgi:hypothetical protein